MWENDAERKFRARIGFACRQLWQDAPLASGRCMAGMSNLLARLADTGQGGQMRTPPGLDLHHVMSADRSAQVPILQDGDQEWLREGSKESDSDGDLGFLDLSRQAKKS